MAQESQHEFNPRNSDETELTVQELDARALEWLERLQRGEDVPDSGQTLSAPHAHEYPRGGTLGVNTLDDDDEFWNMHIRANQEMGRGYGSNDT